MKNRSSNVEPSQNNTGKTRKDKTGLTPRELIRYHINNPDEPIRDEDIENLVLNTNSNLNTSDENVNADAANNRMINDKEIRQIEDHTITTPYDILGD